MRVRHADTLTEGTTLCQPQRMWPRDIDDRPWVDVQYDDGFICSNPLDDLEVWTVFGWL